MEMRMALQEENNILNLIYENIDVPIALLANDLTIESINEKTAKFRQKSFGELLGHKCHQAIFNIINPCPNCAVLKAKAEGKKVISYKLEEIDGQIGQVIQIAIPVLKDGQVEHIIDIIIDNTESYLMQEQEEKDFMNTISTLSTLMELHDPYTAGHSKSVKHLAYNIGLELGLAEQDLKDIVIAALLHDIGKIGVPNMILDKPGRLNSEEFTIVKEHPVKGEAALKNIERFAQVRKIIRHHHEGFSGGGYPDGIGGEKIPLGSRILTIADAYNAMTSDRPYRRAMRHEEALAEIKRNAGNQFDPSVVEAFIRFCRKGLCRIMKEI